MKAQRESQEAKQLRERNEKLGDRLEDAKGRIKHLEATVEALQPKSTEKPAVKRREAEAGSSLDA
ncbi:hypothetical protein D3C81_2034220 [compost metagenome]